MEEYGSPFVYFLQMFGQGFGFYALLWYLGYLFSDRIIGLDRMGD